MVKAICFDLDATLMDSEEIISRSFEYLFKNMFQDGVEKDLTGYSKYMGPHLEDTFGLYAKNKNEIDIAVKEYTLFYKENEFKYVRPMKGALELLKYLKEEGFKLAIISTKRTSSAMPSIKHFGLDKYLDDVICCDILGGKFKPDPYPLLLASEKLNTSPFCR